MLHLLKVQSREEVTGAAVPLPAALVQPFTVCVTVYVPAAVTVMGLVVAPLLQNNVPVTLVAVNVLLPQLFATVTDGAAGVAFTARMAALEFTEPRAIGPYGTILLIIVCSCWLQMIKCRW